MQSIHLLARYLLVGLLGGAGVYPTCLRDRNLGPCLCEVLRFMHHRATNFMQFHSKYSAEYQEGNVHFSEHTSPLKVVTPNPSPSQDQQFQRHEAVGHVIKSWFWYIG